MLLSQIAHLVLVLVLELSSLVVEVLFLSLDDDMELSLLSLDLLNELLEVRDLFEILDLLGGDLLVEDVLLLLVSDLVFEIDARVDRNVLLVDVLLLPVLHWAAECDPSTQARAKRNNVILIYLGVVCFGY